MRVHPNRTLKKPDSGGINLPKGAENRLHLRSKLPSMKLARAWVLSLWITAISLLTPGTTESAAPPPSTASLSAPAAGSTNGWQLAVSFTLSEAATPGSVQLAFTSSGSAERVLGLASTQESNGSHSLTVPVTNPRSNPAIATGSAIPEGTYSLTLRYRNSQNQLISAPTVTGVRLDLTTQPATITRPTSGQKFKASVPVTFNLPEKAQNGSLNLLFTDDVQTYFFPLAADLESAGDHSLSFDPTAPKTSLGVTDGAPLANGSYNVSLEYRDFFGNPIATSPRVPVVIDSDPEAADLEVTLRTAHRSTGRPFVVDYTLPEQAAAITITFEGSPFAKPGDNPPSNISKAVSVTNPALLTAGPHRIAFHPATPSTLANIGSLPNPIPDGTYNVTFAYTDTAANIGSRLFENATVDSDSALNFPNFTPETGAPVPGTDSTFYRFSIPCASGNGDGAYLAVIQAEQGPRLRAVVGGTPSRAIAVSGQPAPLLNTTDSTEGADIPKFLFFGDPVTNSSGDVAFEAVLNDPDLTHGLWIFRNGQLPGDPGTLSAAVLGVDPLPDDFMDIALADNGDLIFTAPSGPNRRLSVWRLAHDAADPEELLSTGDLVYDLEENEFTVKRLALFASFTGTPDQQRGFNSSGSIVLRATVTDTNKADSSALLQLNPGQDHIILLRSGMTLPDSPIDKIKSFSLPSIDDDGLLSVRAVTDAGDTALLRLATLPKSDSPQPVGFNEGTPDDFLETVARTSAASTASTPPTNRPAALPSDTAFASIGDPAGGPSGMFAFLAEVKDSDTTQKSAICASVPGAGLKLLALTGDDAPGAAAPGITPSKTLTNCATTLGRKTVTCDSTDAANPGMIITGKNIPLGTTINSVQPTTALVLNNPATGTGGSLSFTAAVPLTKCATTTGSTKVTCLSTANLVQGMTITGTNIPPGTTLASVTNSTSLVLSANATATGTGLSLTAALPLTNCTTTRGTTAVACARSNGLSPGMIITGKNIPPGTTLVSSQNTTSLVLSTNASDTGSGLTLTAAGVTLANCATTSGIAAVTCASTTSLSPGMIITGRNIPPGATVASVLNTTSFLLSANANGTESGLTLAATGSVVFSSFKSLSWNGRADTSCGPAFLASLRPSTGLTDLGLWAFDASDSLHMLIRKGDKIRINGVQKTVRSFTALSSAVASPSQGHTTTGNGSFLVRLTFSNGSQALVNVSVP